MKDKKKDPMCAWARLLEGALAGKGEVSRRKWEEVWSPTCSAALPTIDTAHGRLESALKWVGKTCRTLSLIGAKKVRETFVSSAPLH